MKNPFNDHNCYAYIGVRLLFLVLTLAVLFMSFELAFHVMHDVFNVKIVTPQGELFPGVVI